MQPDGFELAAVLHRTDEGAHRHALRVVADGHARVAVLRQVGVPALGLVQARRRAGRVRDRLERRVLDARLAPEGLALRRELALAVVTLVLGAAASVGVELVAPALALEPLALATGQNDEHHSVVSFQVDVENTAGDGTPCATTVPEAATSLRTVVFTTARFSGSRR